MASKSQLALPDLSERHKPEGKSARHRSTAPKKASLPRRRGSRKQPPKADKADVIPALLPGNDDDPQAEPVCGAPEDDPRENGIKRQAGSDRTDKDSAASQAAAQDQDEREEDIPTRAATAAEDDTGCEADAADEAPAPDAGQPSGANGGGLDDPELIALLEQLSATIDNANQVLSETPPLVGPVTRLYAPAGAPEMAEPPAPAANEPVAGAPAQAHQAAFREPEAPVMTPPPVAVEKRAGHAGGTALLISGAFLLAVTGTYWWLSNNTELLEDWLSGDAIVALSQDGDAQSTAPGQSIGVKVPVPAVDVPLPPRKPRPQPTTASKPESGPASPAPLNEPAAAEKSVAITEVPADSPPPLTAAQGIKTPPRGPAGEAIDLGLKIPNDEQGYEISVMIQGVPEGAELSKGSKIGGGTWILEEKDVADLALVTPSSFAPREVSLEVAFVKSDGKIPESRTIGVVVEPVHAPVTPATHGLAAANAGKAPPAPSVASMAARGPARGGTAAQGFDDKAEPEEKTLNNTEIPDPAGPPASASAGTPPAEEQKLLAKGREFIELGDIASARLVLEHAARLGSKAAMLALAKTYDPQHLAALGVQGVQPDINQAKAWYERASRKADR